MASISSLSTPALPLITTTPLPLASDGDIPIIDHPDVDNANCRLLGPFALVVQALMGILVMGTLVWKRQREKPRRPWKIWILDITKQMLGQLFVHTLNVLLSNFVANVGEQNPCSLYFLNILIDTTLGVFIIYLTLRITTHVLTDVLGWTGFVSGHYSDRNRSSGANTPNGDRPAAAARSKPRGKGRGSKSRPKFTYWLKQLGMYFFALLVMKIIVTILFVIFPFLFAFGRWLLGLFGSAKNAQVLFVMCLFPLAMNTLQFWLVDSFLRHDPDKSKYGPGRGRTNGSGDITAGAGDDSGIPAWDLNGGANGARRRHLPEYEHEYEYEYDHDEEDHEVGRGADTPSDEDGPVRRHHPRARGAEGEETRLVIGDASDDDEADDKAPGSAGIPRPPSANEARARRRGPAGGTFALNLDSSRSASPPVPSPTSSSSSRSKVHSSVPPRSKQSSRSSSPLSAAVISKGRPGSTAMSQQSSEGGHAYPPTGSGTLPSIEGQEEEDKPDRQA